MSDPMNVADTTHNYGAFNPLPWVTWGSLGLLGLLVVGGWLGGSWVMARSILIGGLLVNGSFWLLRRDAQRLLQRVSRSGEDGSVIVGAEKTRFFVKSLARLVILGLLLFVFASRVPIDVIGLTLGFGTVMVSVVIIGLGVGSRRVPGKV